MRSSEQTPTVDRADEGRVLLRRPVLGVQRHSAARALGPVVTAARDAPDPERRAQLWSTAVELHDIAGHADEAAPDTDRDAMVDALCELAGTSAHDGAGRAIRARAVALAGSHPDRLLRALTCLRAPVIWTDLERGPQRGLLAQRMRDALVRTWPAADRARLLIATVFESGGEDAVAVRYRRACEALDLAHAVGDPELICAALNAVACTLTGPALLTGWRPVAAEMARIADAADLTHYRALAHYLHFRAACRDTDLATARDRARLALDTARGGPLRTQLDVLVAFDAVVELLRGDIDAAERDYREFASRMRESGVARGYAAPMIGDCALAWARGDLAAMRDRLAAAYTTHPAQVAQLYALALLRAGESDRAREIFDEHTEVPRQYFRTLMLAFRAHTAIGLRAKDTAAALFDALLPCSGTLLGFDTGVAVFGPADDLLADLAALLGDEESALILRGRAEAVRERVHSALDTGLAAD